jgi:U3 small nucleolar RNA-associated protein 3
MPKKIPRKAAAVVEDLDLDVAYVDDEEAVVHNKRKRQRGDGVAVAARDAHRLADEVEDYEEEEELAEQAARTARRGLTDDDFTVGTITAAKARQTKSNVKEQQTIMEAVARDFAALSSDERRALLAKEAPELIVMLDEVQVYMEEVKNVADPLNRAIHSRRRSSDERDVLSFLETKVQLMLSYCMHVTFYLLLKTEGTPIKGHPVLDRLVELRVYLEKMRPLEEKLQYTINKMLSTEAGSGANIAGLRAVEREDNGLYQPVRQGGVSDSGKQRRQEKKAIKDAEELEKQEQTAMTRFQQKRTQVPTVDKGVRPADEGYHEDDDQYFSRLVGDGEDDDADAGLSLIERLRKRGTAAPTKREEVVEAEDDDDFEEGDELLTDDDDEGMDYDDLVAQQQQRDEHGQRVKSSRAPLAKPKEVDRRKIGNQIESHRGLTKSRPKDRKTPRTAQRRKFERGMQKVKSQSKSVQPEPDQGFVGVRALRPNVTHSTKFK